MSLVIGDLRYKASILRKSEPPCDVNNPPSSWVPVVENYYVSLLAQNVEERQQMGGSTTVDVFAIEGHYIDGVRPGMRIESRGITYEISQAVDKDGTMAVLSMVARRVA